MPADDVLKLERQICTYATPQKGATHKKKERKKKAQNLKKVVIINSPMSLVRNSIFFFVIFFASSSFSNVVALFGLGEQHIVDCQLLIVLLLQVLVPLARSGVAPTKRSHGRVVDVGERPAGTPGDDV